MRSRAVFTVLSQSVVSEGVPADKEFTFPELQFAFSRQYLQVRACGRSIRIPFWSKT